MKRKKKMNKELFAVNAARKASREEEIRLHGKPVSYRKVEESKKVYKDRKSTRLNSSHITRSRMPSSA